MKCVVCQTDNKEGARVCRKCGVDLQMAPLWAPTWKWHLRVLAVIYVTLIVAYFGISEFLMRIPEPYRLRVVSKDVTPWLKN